MSKIILIILIAFATSALYAADDICTSLEKKIDFALRDAAMCMARAAGDNSVARATYEETKRNGLYLKINNILAIMTMNGCKYSGDIDDNVYSISALDCVLKQLRQRVSYGETEKPVECNFQKNGTNK